MYSVYHGGKSRSGFLQVSFYSYPGLILFDIPVCLIGQGVNRSDRGGVIEILIVFHNLFFGSGELIN